MLIAGAIGLLLAPTAPGFVWTRRAVWALFCVSIWLVYVFSFPWAENVQRETYYALLGTLGLVILYARRTAASGYVGLITGAFLTTIVAFGKHTGVIYTALGLMSVWLTDDAVARALRIRLAFFAVGASAGFLTMLVVTAWLGSLDRFWLWYFIYPARVYRFIHAIPWQTVLNGLDEKRGFVTIPICASVFGTFGVITKLLPRAAAGLTLAPVLQLAAGVLQQKGWNYQFHPAMAGSYAVLLVAVAHAFGQQGKGRTAMLASWALLGVTAWHAATQLSRCPWRTPHAGGTNNWEVVLRHEVARVAEQRTAPTDRVFYYGIDPYTLFFARRRPASPYIISFLFNLDPALRAPPPPDGVGPNETERNKIERFRELVGADLCRRVRANDPAAMIFDQSPGNTGNDAVADVARVCPEIIDLLKQRYYPPLRLKSVRVYFRKHAPQLGG
jgi:hypothetical protein